MLINILTYGINKCKKIDEKNKHNNTINWDVSFRVIWLVL